MNKRMVLPEYRDWQKAVLERDNHICQDCGSIGTHAHHKKGWWESPDERLNLDNGITLCRDCHEKRHGFRSFDKYKAIERVKWGLVKVTREGETVLVPVVYNLVV